MPDYWPDVAWARYGAPWTKPMIQHSPSISISPRLRIRASRTWLAARNACASAALMAQARCALSHLARGQVSRRISTTNGDQANRTVCMTAARCWLRAAREHISGFRTSLAMARKTGQRADGAELRRSKGSRPLGIGARLCAQALLSTRPGRAADTAAVARSARSGGTEDLCTGTSALAAPMICSHSARAPLSNADVARRAFRSG